MKNRYEWILLDLDNTIFDFNVSSRLAFDSFLKDYNVPIENGLYKTYKNINKGVWQQLEKGQLSSAEVKWIRFKQFFEHIGKNEDPHRANEIYLDHLVNHFRFVEGAQEVIEYLNSSYQLGVVTNGLQHVQRARLKRSGIEEKFDVIVISEEIGKAKPQKEYFDEVFKRMNFPGNEKVLIVGDNLSSDIKGGIDYGIDTCWYNHDKVKGTNSLKPTFEIEDLKMLIDIL